MWIDINLHRDSESFGQKQGRERGVMRCTQKPGIGKPPNLVDLNGLVTIGVRYSPGPSQSNRSPRDLHLRMGLSWSRNIRILIRSNASIVTAGDRAHDANLGLVGTSRCQCGSATGSLVISGLFGILGSYIILCESIGMRHEPYLQHSRVVISSSAVSQVIWVVPVYGWSRLTARPSYRLQIVLDRVSGCHKCGGGE